MTNFSEALIEKIAVAIDEAGVKRSFDHNISWLVSYATCEALAKAVISAIQEEIKPQVIPAPDGPVVLPGTQTLNRISPEAIKAVYEKYENNGNLSRGLLRGVLGTYLNALPSEIRVKHKLYQTGEYGVPESICDRNGEVALGLCKICGKGEIELDDPCLPSGEATLKDALNKCEARLADMTEKRDNLLKREFRTFTMGELMALGGAAHNAIAQFNGDPKIPHYTRHIGEEIVKELNHIEGQS